MADFSSLKELALHSLRKLQTEVHSSSIIGTIGQLQHLANIEAYIAKSNDGGGLADSGLYMVLAEGGYPPTKRHDSLDSARKEADRIARKNASPTYVLQAIEKVATTVSFERQDLRVTPTEVIPFRHES